MAGKRRAADRRKKRHNGFHIFLAVSVVLVLFAVIFVGSVRLTRQLEVRERRKAELEQAIREQQERAEELEEFSKYVQTDQFKEEMAREKLGMVKDGEIIFEDEGSR